tara:strand:- start:5207 stop:7672 length:2466 start_codon:yes stop_codon:yes gene_type:complete
MADAKRNLTIQFSAKGETKLIKAIQQLARAQNQLDKSLDKTAESQKLVNQRVSSNTKLAGTNAKTVTKLQSAVSVYRNQMLLASFAIGLVSKGLVDFVKKAGEQEDSVHRLASVFGGETAIALDKYSSELQRASTFGDETINMTMAQIGAFGASAEQTKLLTQATMDLSAGLNLDLNTAGLLVAKTIGSTTDALTRYGVGADGATEQSEKIANIIKSVEEKFGGLAEQLSKTTSGQLAQAANAWGDLGEIFGQAVAPMVLKSVNALKKLAESIDIKTMRALVALTVSTLAVYTAMALKVPIVTAAYFAYNLAIAAAAVATGGLTVALTALKTALLTSGVGAIILAMAALIPVVMKLSEVFDDNNYLLDENGKRVRKLTEAEIKLIAAQKEGEETLEQKLKVLKATNAEERYAAEQKRELSQAEKDLIAEIERFTEAKKAEEELLTTINNLYKQHIDTKIEDAQATIIEIEAQQAWLGNSVKLERALDIATEKYNKLIAAKDGVTSSTEESEKALKKELETLDVRITHDDKFRITLNKLTEVQRVRLKFGDEATDKQIEYAQAIDAISEKLADQIKKEKELAEEQKRLLEEQKIRQESISTMKNMISDFYQSQIDSAREAADAKIAIINEEEKAELETLRNRHRYKKASDAVRADMEKKITDQAEKDRKKEIAKRNKDIKDAFRIQQGIRISEAVMNTSEAYTEALPNVPLSILVAALGAAQIAMIAAEKPPMMKYGGLIGGLPHSQGGTMINAEKGEFVVSKKGVESIGLESLNRINRGGGGEQSISVVINNPMLSKDVVEDELIPQIQEAVRRGSDLGLT